jgi:hypothetical protein
LTGLNDGSNTTGDTKIEGPIMSDSDDEIKRAKRLECQRRYRKRNRETVREWQRRYRERHRETTRLRGARYRERNRAEINARAREHYHRKRDAERGQRDGD